MSTATLPTPPPTATNGLSHPDALFEIINGEIVEKVMSSLATRITGRLNTRLDTFVEEHQLGIVVPEMVFVFDIEANTRRRPDVAFVSKDRWPIDRPMEPEGDWEIIPDLVVEVVSPNDRAGEVIGKVVEYFAHGVREVWVVYPVQRWVDVYDSAGKHRVLREADTLDTPLIPGWSLPLARLFNLRPL